MLKKLFGVKKEATTPASTKLRGMLRAQDAIALRYSIGVSFREMYYLLGWPKVLETGKRDSAHERGTILSPSLAIFTRMVWNHIEDNPLPKIEDFADIRKRFAHASERVGRDNLAHQGWLSILCGFRKNNGNEWSTGKKAPSPTTRHMFWMLSIMAEKHGEEEAMRRWKQAAEEEADARGTTLEEIWESGAWPHSVEERIAGGAADSPSREGSGRKKAGRPAKLPKPFGRVTEESVVDQ